MGWGGVPQFCLPPRYYLHATDSLTGPQIPLNKLLEGPKGVYMALYRALENRDVPYTERNESFVEPLARNGLFGHGPDQISSWSGTDFVERTGFNHGLLLGSGPDLPWSGTGRILRHV